MSETPAVTDYGYAYEYGVDVDVSTTSTPDWQPVRFITGVNPQVSPVTEDAATYDDLGAPNTPKVSESFTLDFGVQQRRMADGKYLPEVEKLLAACMPDKVGEAANVRVRWYDKPQGSQLANPDDAFEGVGSVQMVRAQTGNTGIGGWNVTITGKGRRVAIDNPLTTGGGA